MTSTPIDKSRYQSDSYFDGSISQNGLDAAGYSSYERHGFFYQVLDSNNRVIGNVNTDNVKELAKFLQSNGLLQNKKIVELGCAKGFLVEDLRSLGLNVTGVDISSYAISQANPSIQQFLTNADVMTWILSQGINSFDFVYSVQLLECLTDIEINTLTLALNKITKLKQIHITNETANPTYYNNHTLEELSTMGFKKGTILISAITKRVLVV